MLKDYGPIFLPLPTHCSVSLVALGDSWEQFSSSPNPVSKQVRLNRFKRFSINQRIASIRLAKETGSFMARETKERA